MKERVLWLNGNLVPESQATVHVLSPSCQFGANVFEGVRCYWDSENAQLNAFRLEDHLNRLQRSAKMIRFDCPYAFDVLESAFMDVVKANDFREDIAVRQTVYLDGFGNWGSTSPVGMFIAPIAKGRQLSDGQVGIHCGVSSWERIRDNAMSPRIKVGANYMNSRMAQLEAKQNGFDSALLLNAEGFVSEGPGSCFFMVRNGVLITPPVTASILESITRDSIIEIAKNELNYVVEERNIDRTELYIADEAFFCGTAAEILPILSVDRQAVGDGESVGRMTRSIIQTYFDVVRHKIDTYTKWLSPIYN